MKPELSRRDLLKIAGFGAAGAAVAGLAPRVLSAAAKRPNVLLLFTDDQRWSTLHALTNPEVQTPTMDLLMKRGVTFDHACIMGGTWAAICAPSRAMLMTGRSLFHVNNTELVQKDESNPGRSDQPYTLFPEVLGKAGYRTFATGKWHNGEHSFGRTFYQNADNVFFGGMANHLQVPVAGFDPKGIYPKEQRHTGNKFSSELFTDSAVKFLKSQTGDDPFFMYVAYTAPHDPRMAPKEYTKLYSPDKITLPPNFMPEHPFDNGEMHVRDEELAPHPRTRAVVKEHIAAYYAMITEVDAQMGRVLKALQESGKADNTIIFFAADNGLAVGQHGLLGKQNLYDHSMRVPLVIGGPGLPQGKVAHTLCYLMDVAPTIYEMTGVKAPADVEGKSLMPVLRDQSAVVRDSVFLAYRHFQRGIRTDRWKLILYNVNGTQTTQLFDLQNDPWELKNLAADSSQTSRISELRSKLRDWQKRTDDFVDIDKPNWGWNGVHESAPSDDDL